MSILTSRLSERFIGFVATLLAMTCNSSDGFQPLKTHGRDAVPTIAFINNIDTYWR